MNAHDDIIKAGETKIFTDASKRQLDELKQVYEGVKQVDKQHIIATLGVLVGNATEIYRGMLTNAILDRWQSKITNLTALTAIKEDERRKIFTDEEANNISGFILRDVERLRIMFMGTESVDGGIIAQIITYRGDVMKSLYLPILAKEALETTFAGQLKDTTAESKPPQFTLPAAQKVPPPNAIATNVAAPNR